MPQKPWSSWPARWQAALDACRRRGGEVRDLVVQPPAKLHQVKEVETVLGFRIPEDFRQVLLEFSGEVFFYWFLPEGGGPPGDLKEVSSGGCEWGLSTLLAMANAPQEFIESVPSHAADLDEGFLVWHDKLACHPVPNGDYLSLDLRFTPSPVVYLDHEGGETHGYVLGASFTDFMERWTLLGCPGPEGWELLPFVSSPISGLELHSPRARQWTAWFGLKFEQ